MDDFLANLDKGLYKTNVIALVGELDKWIRSHPKHPAVLYVARSILAELHRTWFDGPVKTAEIERISGILTPPLKALVSAHEDDPETALSRANELMHAWLNLEQG